MSRGESPPPPRARPMRAIGHSFGARSALSVKSCQPMPTRLPTMGRTNTISMSLTACPLPQVRQQRHCLFARRLSRPLGDQLIQLLLQAGEHHVVAEVADLHAFLLEVDGGGAA